MTKIKTYLESEVFIALGILTVLASGLIVSSHYKTIWLTILFFAVVAGSLPIVIRGANAIRKGNFGVDVIAITAIIAALSTGETIAAAIVLFMLSGGASLEKFAENRARWSLEKLLKKAPLKATILVGGVFKIVRINDVNIGDIVAVKKNEIIPVDGVVYKGTSLVDESVITGEPLPRDVIFGDRVVSGSTNEGDFFQLRATASYEKSVFSGIVRLIDEAEQEKAPTVRLADKYSVYFTAFTFSLAGIAFFIDPKLATAVLVVATPCPLLLAAPIAFIAGMSKSARHGVIVKHGGVFETMLNVQAFFFDKTGTLTLGAPSIYRIYSYVAGFSEMDILRYAVSLEQKSTHILAESIIARAKIENVKLLPTSKVTETTGKGIIGYIDGKEYIIGKLSFLESNGVIVLDNDTKNQAQSKPTIYLARGKQYLGKIIFSDTLRKDAKDVIRELASFHTHTDIILMTGDTDGRAHEIARSLGIRHVQSNCLPKDKVSLIERYERQGKVVAMVGDGVNDAPSLAAASVGIALSSHGATVATDIADVVIVVNDLDRITSLLRISKRTVHIAKQSMFVGMGLSIIAMIIALLGYLPPVEGAILQEVIDVLVIVNALRAL